MEQAHYLLNRLRANKDGLQTRKPGEDDLNPNATNGLRLDALQSFLGVGVNFDQLGGITNKLSLEQFQTANNRRNSMLALADAKLLELQQEQLKTVQLTEQLALLNAQLGRTQDPDEKADLEKRISTLTAGIEASKGKVTALTGQVTALTTAAGLAAVSPGPTGGNDNKSGTGGAGAAGTTGGTGSTSGSTTSTLPLPSLTGTSAEYAQPLKGQLLSKTFDTLLNTTASSWGQPRLHASQILDNFVQMQYEIVAKQLTTLRDEVGKGQRVVFLELPTSIAAAAKRSPLAFWAEGGQDRLAQSWWRLKTLYLAYDRENSPCWLNGEDVSDGVQDKLGFRKGHDVDEVPKALKRDVSSSGLRRRNDAIARLEEELIETARAAAANLQSELEQVQSQLSAASPADSATLAAKKSELEADIKTLRPATYAYELLDAVRLKERLRELESKPPAQASTPDPGRKNQIAALQGQIDAIADRLALPGASAIPDSSGQVLEAAYSHALEFVDGRLKRLQNGIEALRKARDEEVKSWKGWQLALRARRDREIADQQRSDQLSQQLRLVTDAMQSFNMMVESSRSSRGKSDDASPLAPLRETIRKSPEIITGVTAYSTKDKGELDTLRDEERKAKQSYDAAAAQARQLETAIKQQEAALLGFGFDLNREPAYYTPATRAKVAGLEQPCRDAQVRFADSEKEYRRRIAELDANAGLRERIQEKIEAAQKSLDSVDERMRQAEKAQAAADRALTSVESRRSQLQAEIALLRRQTPRPADKITARQAELAQVDGERQELEAQRATVDNLIEAIGGLRSAGRSEIDRLTAEKKQYEDAPYDRDEIKKRFDADRRKFSDELEFHQLRIYAAFGGPGRIHKAFRMNIGGRSPDGSDGGMVRAIEILPRQTALNVNSTHALVNNSALSLATKFLFGLGGKVDYQRMRETYDQFIQQEVFASGFGKGDTTFGWTFGPTPGTRVLNPGTRTTYAALTVPSNATGLEMDAMGCSFHHNTAPPATWEDSTRGGAISCTAQNTVTIGLPDRDSSGSFWVDRVRYTKVKPGHRAVIVLEGLFSPETTVLVNGKRLTQLVGLGKPAVAMDSGPQEEAGNGIISGTYEYVNERYVALSLSIPADFKDSKFPSLTIVSPSRTATINDVPLVVNGQAGRRLGEEQLLDVERAPLNLVDLQVIADRTIGGVRRIVTAKLTGDRLSGIEKVWINGTEVDRSGLNRVSDSLALLDFEYQDSFKWNIVVSARGENSDRIESSRSSSLTVTNPLKLFIAGVNVKSGAVEYDKDKNPIRATIILSGSGFRPPLTLSMNDRGQIESQTFVAPDQWHCVVKDPKPGIVFTFSEAGRPLISSTEITVAKKSADPADNDKEKPKTTVTEIQTQKKVTQK